MKLLDLALNPRKAKLRFNPFTNELPPGMARKLEYFFGDRSSIEPGERALASRDASTPPGLMNLLIKRNAWGVARPKVRGELIELIRYANQNNVPIVPRGAGTSGYGGSVPTEGGIVVDLRDFNRVLAIDKDRKTVRVEGNITFANLDAALRAEGLTLRQYPTSFYGATVAGWLAQGGGGVGSLRYGPFRNDVVSALVMQPDGKVREFAGADLDLVSDTHGTAGFILEVTLRVRQATQEVLFLATFEELDASALAARRIAIESRAWSLHYHTPEYADMVNEAAKAKILPGNRYSIMVALESADDAHDFEKVKAILLAAGGTLERDDKAKGAWDARFNHLNLKRLGPSVVVSEALVPAEKIKDGVERALAAAKAEKQCVWAIAVSSKHFDLIYYALDDERRATYPTALGNSLAVIDVAKKLGGRAYSSGVLGANEAEEVVNGKPQNMLARAMDVRRGAAATVGVVGSAIFFAVMAAIVMLGWDAIRGYDPALDAFVDFWNIITGAKFVPTFGLGILTALVAGGIVGAIFAAPLAVMVFQRGEPILNTLVGVIAGGTLFVIVHLVAQVYMIGISIWGFVIAILSGALGTLWVLPVTLAGAIILRNHAGRLGRLEAYRAKTDPQEVFNPGPVLGARTRPMPLPVHDMPLQLGMTAPLLTMQRGFFKWHGGEKTDPSFTAVNRTIGKAHAGELSQHAYDVVTCIHCAFCNHVAPEAHGANFESELPRGRVQLAKSVLDGSTVLTQRLHRNLARAPLSHAEDAICPTSIPIARVTDLLLARAASEFGPLPEQEALVTAVEKEGNVLGKPNATRAKWAALAWAPDSNVLFFGDDEGSFNAPETLFAAARALVNGGSHISYLGPAEKTSGATLYESGLRDAARPAVSEMLELCAKRGITAVISPDANAVRAINLDWPIVAAGDQVESPKATHTTEALAAQLKAKRLEFASKWEKKVVYHAPEALQGAARSAGTEILKALGATVIATAHKDCGHGRALHLTFPDLQARTAEAALQAAIAAGAEAIVTASPGCTDLLKRTAKKAKAAIEIVDLHALVSEHMKVAEGGVAVAVAAPAAAEPEVAVEPEIPADHFRVEFVKEKKVIAVHKNANILDAGAEAGLDLPSSCKAGSCDTCSARWEGVAPEQSAGTALNAEQQKKFVLTCIARPRGPVKIWSEERP